MSFADGLIQVGYHDLDGKAGFKLAMQERSGRFYLYVGSMWEPGLFILDVTESRDCRLVRFLPGPANTWTIQVQVAAGRMITNLEHVPAGWSNGAGEPRDGFVIWDVSDPEDPRELGTWTSGGSGTHRNFFDGGRYVHAATSLPGFIGRVYGIVDIDDPEHPRLVGKWWYPGQHVVAVDSRGAHDAGLDKAADRFEYWSRSCVRRRCARMSRVDIGSRLSAGWSTLLLAAQSRLLLAAMSR